MLPITKFLTTAIPLFYAINVTLFVVLAVNIVDSPGNNVEIINWGYYSFFSWLFISALHFVLILLSLDFTKYQEAFAWTLVMIIITYTIINMIGLVAYCYLIYENMPAGFLAWLWFNFSLSNSIVDWAIYLALYIKMVGRPRSTSLMYRNHTFLGAA